MSALPAWAHEAVVAPAALALIVVHARRALGTARALVEVGALVAYGYALEWVAMAVFRSHDYGRAWRVAPGGVPVAVALVWASVILAAATIAVRRGMTSVPRVALAAVVTALSLDLLMEPVAVRAGLWRWTPAGAWQDVPVGNFVGWAVIVGAWIAGTERARFGGSVARLALRRAALATGSIAALVAVGLSWRGLGLERAFGPAVGWIVAATIWTATLAVLGRRRVAAPWPETLAGRLGATSGLEPEVVMLGLAAVFAADAVLLCESGGGQALAVIAGATVAVITFVSVASGRFGLGDAWRGRALSRFAGARNLVAVLMKPPNGQAWTEDDRRFLKGELRTLARWTPGFLLFLLPGGMLLLIVYAHVLDRRRLKRPANG